MSGVHCQHLGSALADEAALWVSCHRATQPPFHPFLLLSSLLGHKQLVSLLPLQMSYHRGNSTTLLM